MTIYRASELNDQRVVSLCTRLWRSDPTILDAVRAICLDVKENGDQAARTYAEVYDQSSTESFRVTKEEFAAANEMVAPELVEAMQQAVRNIKSFHEAQLQSEDPVETLPGVTCWRERRPIECVGIYVPAGSSPLPSTMLMLGVPAVLAGCTRIVACSPPKGQGSVDPLVLVAAQLVGVHEIYKIGGAQAIAALAYGTESIPKVDKIFGPGNQFVTVAKQIVAADVDGAAIDLAAGPSELLVIADDTADPICVAWDLISQAEHDPNSQVVLVTDDESLPANVRSTLMDILADLPRNSIVRQALAKSFALIVESMDEAVRFSNTYAPEHLVLNVRSPEKLAREVWHAGSVFLGSFSPVTAGDYASGTNHTLPTGGSARWTSGVSVESFQKIVTFQSITREGLRRLAPTLTLLAEAEGLEAHKQAVTVRLQTPTPNA